MYQAITVSITLSSLPLSSDSHPLSPTKRDSAKQRTGAAGEIPPESCVPQTGRTGAGATPWKPVLHSRTLRKLLHPDRPFQYKARIWASESPTVWWLFYSESKMINICSELVHVAATNWKHWFLFKSKHLQHWHDQDSKICWLKRLNKFIY